MTRKEVLQEFEVRDGIITSPGKFEGEPIYAPYYWAMDCMGMADEYVLDVAIFFVTDQDRKEFPELDQFLELVEIWSDDQGFVHINHGYMGETVAM